MLFVWLLWARPGANRRLSRFLWENELGIPNNTLMHGLKHPSPLGSCRRLGAEPLTAPPSPCPASTRKAAEAAPPPPPARTPGGRARRPPPSAPLSPSFPLSLLLLLPLGPAHSWTKKEVLVLGPSSSQAQGEAGLRLWLKRGAWPGRWGRTGRDGALQPAFLALGFLPWEENSIWPQGLGPIQPTPNTHTHI